MSKKLIYIAMWDKELEELIEFLKEHKYSKTEITHMEMLLDETRYNKCQ